MNKNIILSFIILLFFGCIPGEESTMNNTDREIIQDEYAGSEKSETPFENYHFELTSDMKTFKSFSSGQTLIIDKKNSVADIKIKIRDSDTDTLVFPNVVQWTESTDFIFFLVNKAKPLELPKNLENEKMQNLQIMLSSSNYTFVYYNNRYKEGYIIPNFFKEFTISPNGMYLIRPIEPDDSEKLINHFELYSLPDLELESILDLADDISFTPPYMAYEIQYSFTSDTVAFQYIDDWGEMFSEITVNLNGFNTSVKDIKYSKVLPEVPSDAVWIDSYSVIMKSNNYLDDKTKSFSYNYPNDNDLSYLEWSDENDDWVEISTITDVEKFWFLEDLREVILIIQNDSESFSLEIYNIDEQRTQFLDSGMDFGILSEDNNLFGYISGDNYDLLKIYNIQDFPNKQTIEITDILKEFSEIDKIRFVSLDSNSVGFLFYSKGKEYWVDCHYAEGSMSYNMIEVNQYEKPEFNLPSIH